MAGPQKSPNITDRLGAYKAAHEVPDEYSLRYLEDAYAGEDTFQAFCEASEYHRGDSEWYRNQVERAGRKWKAFMAETDRHHALALPADVDEWCGQLRNAYTIGQAHEYWRRIRRFYTWLTEHTDHPHVYNPALIAANTGEHVPVLWDWQVTQTRKSRRERDG